MGFFYFVGRKDDIIKSRGEKVAPKEVENVIHASREWQRSRSWRCQTTCLGRRSRLLLCRPSRISRRTRCSPIARNTSRIS